MSINSFLSNLLFSDKMNSRNKIILSGALLALVMLVTTNVFFTSSALAVGVETGTSPDGQLAVFVIKKAALICDKGAQAPSSQDAPEIGGCVDNTFQDSALYGNTTGNRFNQYLFSGEQLAELVVARDLSGATFLSSTAALSIGGSQKVVCTEIPYSSTWYGHDVHILLGSIPPAMGISDTAGFSATYDKLYNCLVTVTPSMVDYKSVAVTVTDSLSRSATTEAQKWYFNPAISISISFDSGSSVLFPHTQPGQTVYSTNTLIIKNTAAGGVDLAAYLVGNDLYDTSGVALCPDSNILSVTNIAYRCKVGTFMSETFTPLQHLKEAAVCKEFNLRHCLVDTNNFNDLLPDASYAWTSILYNQHQAECWFKLTVPVPCAGTFTNPSAIEVLVRAL